MKLKGSPPHMRGKEFLNLESLPQLGITPAYAGKSTAGAAFDRAVEDHPRICGDKVYRALSPDFHQGSPPHMRGKATSATMSLALYGITPAYAGKSRGICALRPPERDHPRICGEKGTQSGTVKDNLGSPPHMRGKAGTGKQGLSCEGITPAYAGKRNVVVAFYNSD